MSDKAIHILLFTDLFLLAIALVAVLYYSRRRKKELKRNDDLFQQVERYRDLFEKTEVGISHTDMKGRFVFVNLAAAKRFGFDKPEDLYDERINSIHFYAEPAEAEGIREQLKNGKRIHNHVIQIKRRDGRLSYVMVSLHARFDAKGNPVGFESIGHDVTDRVMLEQELVNYSDNLEARVRKKTAEILRLQRKKFDLEKLAAVGETTASLVNLMSGLLSILRNCLDRMKEKVSFDETTNRMMGLLEQEGKQVRRLLNDSLHFATPEGLHPVPQNVHPILDLAAGRYEEEFKKKGIAFHREYALGIPPVSVDSDRFSQVIMNLLQNAIDALRDEDGGIVLKTEYRPDDASLRISVEDNGAGISEEDLKKLFDPFFTRKQKGTGLGLPVARKIVEAHSGTVSIESQPGRGTRVRIELPVDPRPSLHDPV
jgi:PAS domain S-box-containing protein